MLCLTQIDKDDLGRGAKLSWANLTNPGSAKITTTKYPHKMDRLSKRLIHLSNDLTVDLTNLIVSYTLTTNFMTYNRGNGERIRFLSRSNSPTGLLVLSLKILHVQI